MKKKENFYSKIIYSPHKTNKNVTKTVDSDHQISNNNNSNSSVNNHNHNHVRRSLANNENQTLISSSISSQQQQTQQQLKQLLTSDPHVDNNYYSLPIGKLEVFISIFLLIIITIKYFSG